MNQATQYIPQRLRAQHKRELERARLGRAIAERIRHEATEQQRASARAAREARTSPEPPA